MTKKELIEQIQQQVVYDGWPPLLKTAVDSLLEGLAKVAAQQLARGHDFTLPGIAKFRCVERPARKGRNPRSGEAVDIPAKLAVKAKALKALNDAVAQRNTMEVA